MALMEDKLIYSGSSFGTRSGREEAIEGVESGDRRAEKRASSGGQAPSQEPCSACWFLVRSRREITGLRVHAK